MKQLSEGLAAAGALGVGFFLFLNTLNTVVRVGSEMRQPHETINDADKSLAIFECHTAQNYVTTAERVSCDREENWSHYLD